MASQEEFDTISSFGNNTTMMLLFSLVLPVVIKVFLNIGIIFDIIWDLFNMLQLIANILNLCVQS